MALRIEYEQEALEDIVVAGRTAHERFGPEVANRLLDQVRNLVDLLATQPDMGHPRTFRPTLAWVSSSSFR